MLSSTVLVLFMSATLPTVYSAPVIAKEHTSITEHAIHSDIQPAFYGYTVAEPDHHAEEEVTPYALADIHPRERSQRKKKIITKHRKAAASNRRQTRLDLKDSEELKNSDIRFGNAATAKLDEMKLKGKNRKRVMNYHRKIVKQDMATVEGAISATVVHLAHKGGSVPTEPYHVTVGYWKALNPETPGGGNDKIKSSYSISQEAKYPGKKTRGLFHVYPEGQNKKVPVPAAWKHAVRGNKARQQAAAWAAKVHADEMSAAAAVRTAQHIAELQQAGKSRTREDAQALRFNQRVTKKAEWEAKKQAKKERTQGQPQTEPAA
ncbi:hypothetical protein D9619_008692 [Psilocybe cf. subviscida]|uniref:Uncharacterized protein n=1 Tax=Psilocybe cf. subviscida TaxID=2480587 RepID=A0A8H5F148_9AGAR|nr:hypothetical protein D9619_008692 [Psilocybe cf. subviscida]